MRPLALCGRYAAWRSAFRQYWLDDDAHSLAASVRRGEVQWFPIGMNPQWVRLVERIRNGSLTIPRASARRHRISFLGSTHKSDRAMRIAAVERASYMRVHHHAGDRACYGKGCADTRYVDETLDSVLCLHLPGSSVESNRLYEQLEGGWRHVLLCHSAVAMPLPFSCLVVRASEPLNTAATWQVYPAGHRALRTG